MNYNYIAIEGTVGAGKTTLATRIGNDFNGKLVLEEFEGDKNPFLPKFYKEPDKYSFQVEMTFLALRYQQLKDKLGALDLFHDFIISDYYVAKSLIFSKNNLQDDEYQLFSRFFNIIFSDMPKPELLVYLYSDVERLQANIRKRGRAYEQEISDTYLDNIISYLNLHNSIGIHDCMCCIHQYHYSGGNSTVHFLPFAYEYSDFC